MKAFPTSPLLGSSYSDYPVTVEVDTRRDGLKAYPLTKEEALALIEMLQNTIEEIEE